MVAQDIFLGSGASITKVPEVDIFIDGATRHPSGAFNGTTIDKINVGTNFAAKYLLVNNLYVGCILERYAASTTTLLPAITTVTFNSDLKTDYDDLAIVLKVAASGGASVVTKVVSFDSTGSLTYTGNAHSGVAANLKEVSTGTSNLKEEIAALFVVQVNALADVSATRNGAVVTITNDNGGNGGSASATLTTKTELDGTAHSSSEIALSTSLGTTVTSATGSPISEHRITENDASSITFTPSVGVASNDTFVIKSYGAPCPAPKDSTQKRLLADSWIGIAESITFPQTEVEMKQTNISLGGSRNFTYQYKGIETAGTADLNIVANHGAWLYYFFGECSSITATLDASKNPDTNLGFNDTAHDGKFFLNPTPNNTGPLFYRAIGNTLCPPVADHLEDKTDLDELTYPTGTTAITNPITYAFTEANDAELPSFSLEQVFSKLPSTNQYRTNTAADHEDTNFVKIARGCRVNTLTMTANENEEIKMTLSCNTRNVHTLEQNEPYEAKRGASDETQYVNYKDTQAEFREPFFFSDGTLKAFGTTFVRLTSLTLTMNNTLTDKRYLGVGNKTVQRVCY